MLNSTLTCARPITHASVPHQHMSPDHFVAYLRHTAETTDDQQRNFCVGLLYGAMVVDDEPSFLASWRLVEGAAQSKNSPCFHHGCRFWGPAPSRRAPLAEVLTHTTPFPAPGKSSRCSGTALTLW